MHETNACTQVCTHKAYFVPWVAAEASSQNPTHVKQSTQPHEHTSATSHTQCTRAQARKRTNSACKTHNSWYLISACACENPLYIIHTRAQTHKHTARARHNAYYLISACACENPFYIIHTSAQMHKHTARDRHNAWYLISACACENPLNVYGPSPIIA